MASAAKPRRGKRLNSVSSDAEDSAGAYHLCNATGDAMIWAFEPIGEPLKFPEQVS